MQPALSQIKVPEFMILYSLPMYTQRLRFRDDVPCLHGNMSVTTLSDTLSSVSVLTHSTDNSNFRPTFTFTC